MPEIGTSGSSPTPPTIDHPATSLGLRCAHDPPIRDYFPKKTKRVCRSAHAAMWTLARSGVCFRTLTNDDGTIAIDFPSYQTSTSGIPGLTLREAARNGLAAKTGFSPPA
jgi:hypothetical protein